MNQHFYVFITHKDVNEVILYKNLSLKTLRVHKNLIILIEIFWEKQNHFIVTFDNELEKLQHVIL